MYTQPLNALILFPIGGYMKKARKKIEDVVSTTVGVAGGGIAAGEAAGKAAGKAFEEGMKQTQKQSSTPPKPKSFDGEGIAEYDKKSLERSRKLMEKMLKTLKDKTIFLFF